MNLRPPGYEPDELPTALIRREAAACRRRNGPAVEPLDGAYCRVHLDYLKEGLDSGTLAGLFALSAEPGRTDTALLEEKLSVMLELAEQGLLPFPAVEAADAADRWRQAGFPPCHHSDAFRQAYAPAYRLMKREYAHYLPLFARVDRMMREKDRVILAIEGGSASGKTTLGELIGRVYGCPVFHMDDFFLRPEQRTAERYAQPGGNVDRERFLEEVLAPLRQGQPVRYRRFDCQTFSLLPPVTVLPERLCVVEGAYSMHPDLAGYYDLSVFLDITPELQRRRILLRNGPEMAERFFSQWIPLEQLYFQAFGGKERCDMAFGPL